MLHHQVLGLCLGKTFAELRAGKHAGCKAQQPLSGPLRHNRPKQCLESVNWTTHHTILPGLSRNRARQRRL